MIRRLKSVDRKQIKHFLKDVDEFSGEEKEVALELIDESLDDPDSEDSYIVYVYEENKKVLGYYCIAKRDLTDGVYDLYWIVVKPGKQNKGIGKKLMTHCEKFVKDLNGRWILIETSSQPNYERTRNFYLRNFYTIVTEIKDFYSKGDSLVIFGKYLTT